MMIDRGLSSKAFYFLGDSGTGKTTLAQCLCNELKIDALSITSIAGAEVNAEFVRKLSASIHCSSLFDMSSEGWQAVIVDEAHSMSGQAVQLWLPLLERLPAKRLICFTSNAGLEAYGAFSGALMSRCAVFSLELDKEAAAQHVAKIASDENLNGQPIEAYRALMKDCDWNIRAALQRVECGVMLKPYIETTKAISDEKRIEAIRSTIFTDEERIAKLCAALPSKPIEYVSVETFEASKKATQARIQHKSAKRTGSGFGSIESEIKRELEYGKKLCAGSPKHSFHLARLAALEAQR
jgi:replication-associated recombination protein RarA